ncbi:MAG TPA: flagellar hook assembly protein FlgD [Myxococcales bacterium LLY-WYZ-16_1]|jgi:flagellar basal-body rod modification protein FlgD|nr:flagellar hook assembly protein FlgD [Myxococcales bacterium LLY-WYZ-16_1]
MNVNQITNASGTSVTPNGTPSNELGQNQFLELMLVQMQNQSPLDPMNSEQFLGQLAQFSTIEQLTSVNAGIQDLAVGQAGIVAGQTVSMIGHHVVYDGADTQLVDGKGTIRYQLGAPASSVLVRVKNEDGVTVRTYELEQKKAGEHSFRWNGSEDGSSLPDGTYTFEVEALNAEGNPVTVETFSSGRVEGVTYKNGIPELIIGTSRREPSQVIRIGDD